MTKKENKQIKKLHQLAKMNGLDLDQGMKFPSPKPRDRKCEICKEKKRLYLYRSDLENSWIWACKDCEAHLNYEFFYIYD